ncbi:pyridoxamine 5'-phosphate oxidase [Alcaligenes faecalis]|uniref:pyridoxamine 5'-phosphate oxidase n=1 Tax=Alcaligenes faecalis TaxID=511 RepID=UPI0029331B87|nr:pyridoxamine 5'-phosphate oxidase [Alcaligenes faecalis]MDV2115000.1 pyridoxamine 5'-phosphate oxidase [Alcaligenes faecalis]
MSLADLRNEYERFSLSENELRSDPRQQFQHWLDQAIELKEVEPTAMTLATVSPEGRPSARIVLLKAYDEQGLVFFTNYQSRKGTDLDHNPWASLSFFWASMQRQVRFEGRISRISAAESDEYFHSRPLGSRIGAWASPQSQPISRTELDTRAKQYTESLGEHPARPEHWGGFRLTPDHVEFWQGRASRLHDRLVFDLKSPSDWQVSRLAP